MRYCRNGVAFALVIIEIHCHNNLLSYVDTRSLSELPLEALLNIKKNLPIVEDENENITTKENIPEALPLLYGSQEIKKADCLDDSSYKDEKKKSVSKIFQVSIISLSFLVFGGYLLFLIIAAIKDKPYNYVYDPNTTLIISEMVNAELNKRRKRRKKRPIRGRGNFVHIAETGNAKSKRDLSSYDINVEQIYNVLINLCEGYNKIVSLDQ